MSSDKRAQLSCKVLNVQSAFGEHRWNIGKGAGLDIVQSAEFLQPLSQLVAEQPYSSILWAAWGVDGAPDTDGVNFLSTQSVEGVVQQFVLAIDEGPESTDSSDEHELISTLRCDWHPCVVEDVGRVHLDGLNIPVKLVA